jgi:hypothetical protein
MQGVVVVSHAPGFRALVGRALSEHRWLFAVILLYSLLGLLVSSAVSGSADLVWGLYSLTIFHVTGLFLVVAALVYPLWIMVVVRPARLSRYLLTHLRTRVLVPARLIRGGLVLVALPPFMSIYTSMKRMIPSLYPFSWDQAFMAWDRALHGGLDPWVLLQPILGHPPVTFVVSFLYQAWVFVMYGVLLWQAFTLQAPRLRMQFLLTFLLSWAFLGTLLATVLASGGPCYYARLVGGQDPFAPLLGYLHHVAADYRIPALTVQEDLWKAYVGQGIGQGVGISAMPSMHVATSVLFALVGWGRGARLGAALSAFAVIILLGSVHLGWHYAVDGYVSAALTVLLWRSVGWALSHERALPCPPDDAR